jgi:hypothetical protein
MKPSKDLFNLIKSLGQTEKRYFKMYAAKLSDGREHIYLQLFQAIDNMAEYEEDLLKEKFKGKGFIKQFHVAKIYLTGVILQSLVAYHHESSAHNNLLKQLQIIEILYDKELHALCYKQIEKGIRLCKNHSKQNFLFHFLDWQTKLLIRRQQYDLALSAIEEQKKIIINFSSYLHSKERAIKIHQINIKKGYPRTSQEIDKLTEEVGDLFSYNTSKDAMVEEIYYHLIAKSNYYAGIGEHKKRREIIRQLVDFLEKNMNYSLEHPQLYITALNNYYNALVNTGQLKLAKSIFSKIRQLSQDINSKRRNAKNYALLISYNIELEISTLSNETHKTILLAPRIAAIVENAEGVLQKSLIVGLIYNTARVFFISANYDGALDWLNRILNEGMAQVREDLNGAARILYLIVHYELGNKTLLQNMIVSTKKSLKYKFRLFKPEQLILECLQKLNGIDNENEKQIIYKELSMNIEVMYTNTEEAVPELLTDVFAWINSKITGRAMGKILAEKYLQEVNFIK